MFELQYYYDNLQTTTEQTKQHVSQLFVICKFNFASNEFW